MGYMVALMPVEVGSELAMAQAVYGRWPASGITSTVESEAMLASLISRWPSIAERPSRVSEDIVIDDEAPFQIDIDGGLTVLDVRWDSLVAVMPDVHALATASGVAMFLPDEREVVQRSPADQWAGHIHGGRLVRPDDADLVALWVARQERELQIIHDAIEVGHEGTRWHDG